VKSSLDLVASNRTTRTRTTAAAGDRRGEVKSSLDLIKSSLDLIESK